MDAITEAMIVASTEVASDMCISFILFYLLSVAATTLVLQSESAELLGNATDEEDETEWACIPDMRITTVCVLDNGDPTMAAALRQLAALP